MEIYVYGLILAGYLVLWFASRDCEGRGITRMADFLYTRGRVWRQKIKWGGLFQDDAVRRDLSLLYPYGRLEGEERQFYVERIRMVLMILLAGDILAAAGYAAAGGNMLLREGGLVREEIGGEDRSTELDAYIVEAPEEDGITDVGSSVLTDGPERADSDASRVYQGSYRLEVRSRKFSGQQAKAMADKVFALLPERILGENRSLDHVTMPLDLPVSVEGYPFQIVWESSSYALVDSNGTVGNLGLEEGESSPVTLTAVLSYDNGVPGGLRYEKEYAVNVFGPELSEEEKLSRQIREAILSADEKSASEQELPLPGQMGEQTIVWEERAPDSGIALLVFAGIVSFLAAAAMGSRLHEKVIRRERQMRLDYPQIISKFVLYLGAGLSVRSTFMKLGEDYTRQRERDAGARRVRGDPSGLQGAGQRGSGDGGVREFRTALQVQAVHEIERYFGTEPQKRKSGTIVCNAAGGQGVLRGAAKYSQEAGRGGGDKAAAADDHDAGHYNADHYNSCLLQFCGMRDDTKGKEYG